MVENVHLSDHVHFTFLLPLIQGDLLLAYLSLLALKLLASEGPRLLIQFLVVVELLFGRLFHLAILLLVLEEFCSVFNRVIIHIAEYVGEFFLAIHLQLDLFWYVIFHISVGSTNSRLVYLILVFVLSADVVNPCLEHGSFEATVYSDYEFH